MVPQIAERPALGKPLLQKTGGAVSPARRVPQRIRQGRRRKEDGQTSHGPDVETSGERRREAPDVGTKSPQRALSERKRHAARGKPAEGPARASLKQIIPYFPGAPGVDGSEKKFPPGLH